MDSNKKPSRLYAAIFYPCMLAAVMLVGVVLFSPDGGIAASSSLMPETTAAARVTAPPAPVATAVPAPEITQLSLRWSASQLKGLLQQALDSADMGLCIEEVALLDSGTIELQGSASRETIAALIERSHTEEGRLLQLATRFLPDELQLTVGFTISCTNGNLALTPTSLVAGTLSLPVNLIPESACADFASLAHTTLQQQGCSLERLFITENMLYLDCVFTKISG